MSASTVRRVGSPFLASLSYIASPPNTITRAPPPNATRFAQCPHLATGASPPHGTRSHEGSVCGAGETRTRHTSSVVGAAAPRTRPPSAYTNPPSAMSLAPAVGGGPTSGSGRTAAGDHVPVPSVSACASFARRLDLAPPKMNSCLCVVVPASVHPVSVLGAGAMPLVVISHHPSLADWFVAGHPVPAPPEVADAADVAGAFDDSRGGAASAFWIACEICEGSKVSTHDAPASSSTVRTYSRMASMGGMFPSWFHDCHLAASTTFHDHGFGELHGPESACCESAQSTSRVSSERGGREDAS
mmetsp:Transcript_5370/g.13974  ORF Transcript_5370/g.13974 Transcript_5370/m.13974 type:complete len:301 (+) Transcript_5370:606-1508(+)